MMYLEGESLRMPLGAADARGGGTMTPLAPG